MMYSFLISTYANDNFRLFKLAVSSIQLNLISYAPLLSELVLVIDGPVDDEVLHYVYTLKRNFNYIRVVELASNVGLASALNAGLKVCQGKWIIRCDADDISLPNRMESIVPFLSSDFDVISTATVEVDDLLSVSHDDLFSLSSYGSDKTLKKVPLQQKDIVAKSVIRNPVNHNSVAFRREVVINVGGYPDLFLKEDFGLWLILLHHGFRFIGLESVTVVANAGLGLSKRRGGVKQIRSEFGLAGLQFRLGIHNRVKIFFSLFIRLCFVVLPTDFRHFLFVKVLRR